MQYQRKPLLVDAIKITTPTNVNGKTGHPGDYLITLPNGELGFMPAHQFEANFEPYLTDQTVYEGYESLAAGVTPPDLEPESPAKPLMICLGCGDEVPPEEFERKTGMCVECLKKQVTCHNCGRTVYQYEIIGTMCRKCLPPKSTI